jgi:FAD/FMN-containing dehydrogenase
VNKVAHYLQEHLIGEVFTSPDTRNYFSTDGSIFRVVPSFVVYPRNENDIRKTARFAWQLAERGRVIPLTARGMGTDLGGAAIGSGIILVFPAHMHKVLELDPKSGVVAVQPGANFGKLQQTLHTHGRFVPVYPNAVEYTSVGGAVSNNCSGERSGKYGSARDYVKGLRIVLANGELIETGRISKRELSKKMGLSSLEGEIYRAVDALIEENKDVIANLPPLPKLSSAGYALADVKRKDGSFDLTPLIVGSQGTLALISEVVFESEAYNPETTVMTATFTSRSDGLEAAKSLSKMGDSPAVIDFLDKHLLEDVNRINPQLLKEVIETPLPEMLLYLEFDNDSSRRQKQLAKKARKIIEQHNGFLAIASEEHDIDRLKAVRDSASTMWTHVEGSARALPIIDDAVVPVAQLGTLLGGIDEMMQRNNQLVFAITGSALSGAIRVLPHLDMTQIGDRQKMFRMIDEFYTLVISLGGSISTDHGDGRLRGSQLVHQFGETAMALFSEVKKAFDPYGILNPNVKVDVTIDDLKPLLRADYSARQNLQHMPRI